MTLQTKECHEAGENLNVQEKSSPASSPSCYHVDFSLQKLHFFLSFVIVFIQIKKKNNLTWLWEGASKENSLSMRKKV